MTKTRAFPLFAFAFAAATVLDGAIASAGPVHPCDDRIVFIRPQPRFVRPVIVQPVIARTIVVQSAAAPSTVVTVPAGSDVAIRQSWAGDTTVRVSTPTNTTAVVVPGYRAAWADSGDAPVAVSSAPVYASPSVIVIPDYAVVGREVAVEPFGAHDRLVVLNEFTRPGLDGRALLYRDATGLLHERTVYSNGGIFYDHLGRRCRYDHDRSAIVILDGRVVRDYNRNGVCDDDRYLDLHRRAELQFHNSTVYRPIGTPYRPGGDWRDRHRSDALRGSPHSPSHLRDNRPADVRRLSSGRPAGGAVNGRLSDDSRLTGNDRRQDRSGARPKR